MEEKLGEGVEEEGELEKEDDVDADGPEGGWEAEGLEEEAGEEEEGDDEGGGGVEVE